MSEITTVRDLLAEHCDKMGRRWMDMARILRGDAEVEPLRLGLLKVDCEELLKAMGENL
jgi:hypothetical protein